VAKALRGLRVRVKPDPFFPARVIKTAAEVRQIEAGCGWRRRGCAPALEALRACRIGSRWLALPGPRRATADDIRGVINAAIAGRGGVAADTIVAGGNQGCDPHEIGHGPCGRIKQSFSTYFPATCGPGYWGDLTRTVVRGRAARPVSQSCTTPCSAGRNWRSRGCGPEWDGKEIHDAIQSLFRENGYLTRRTNGRMQGFFHGTGTGWGWISMNCRGLAASRRSCRRAAW